ncbi:TerC family protein [Flavobacterium sp. xlx-214]|uniref:TerC family protein n=1 Tax=unclassified Flavobacterium TaxID=196869 RepID=UPI0013D82393|nr:MULTISPECIES: TerC family protein [unclassified Flavobacterium]MBA5794075.1 TerC family protein [Flavobacterium sp. xlx-221]QMI83700.1 TerC family protein [Flavobacterium sp. xlx-214]
MEILFTSEAIIAFLTLTFLEIILGIDNVIFISIVTGKLPEEKRKKATQIGLFLAMFMRIALLFAISWLTRMKAPLFSIDWGWFSAHINGQALILLGGGIFLIYKSTKEIHEKVNHIEHITDSKEATQKRSVSFSSVIAQILMIDLIFSVDSILTAVGMTNGLYPANVEIWGQRPELIIMITAVIVSVAVMMAFAVPVGKFVNKNPSIQILALSFLILIGFMLTTESMHLSEAVLAGEHIGAVPKGYLYFAIAFSLVVEFLNMRLRKKSV